MNDDNVSVCRKTGIMRSKVTMSKKPEFTVTRADYQYNDKHTAKGVNRQALNPRPRPNRVEQDYYRYENDYNSGWDTEPEEMYAGAGTNTVSTDNRKIKWRQKYQEYDEHAIHVNDPDYDNEYHDNLNFDRSPLQDMYRGHYKQYRQSYNKYGERDSRDRYR